MYAVSSPLVLILIMLGSATLTLGYVLGPLGRTAAAAPPRRRTVATVLALSLIGLTMAAYLRMGSPDAVTDSALRPPDSLAGLAAALQQRLQADPRDVDTWHLLGQAELALGNPAAAATALERALTLAPRDPVIQVDLADALGQMQGSRLDGRPITLIRAALEQSPQLPKALALAGAYAVVQHDFATALQHWRTLLEVLPADAPQAAQIRGFVADLDAGRAPRAPEADTHSVRGTVRLAPALKAQLDPQATLFIVARALNDQGQPSGPPLAVLRGQAGQLPWAFVLDDRHAMSPQHRLSALPDPHALQVVARITRSGQAAAQPGDLQGQISPVHRDGSSIDLVIDHVIGN
jgi:cytochrome c-type biogenesis protein CcmH